MTSIRWMCASDLPQVVAIERLSFPDPFDRKAFLHHLELRRGFGYVIADRRKVFGYAMIWCAEEAVYLESVAVHPAERMKGFGRGMMDFLLSTISTRDKGRRLRAECCELDLDTQMFFRACGMRATRVLRGACDEGHDIYRFSARPPKPCAAVTAMQRAT